MSDNETGEQSGEKRKDSPVSSITEPSSLAAPRAKRERKTAARFQTDNYLDKPVEINIINGRGAKLRDIPATLDSIESFHPNNETLQAAFRLVFTNRKIPNAQKKEHLLDFSGFLEKINDENEDKDKRDKIDEDAEAKMSTRAFKLKSTEVRDLCDFFAVNRRPGEGEKASKDFWVDCLLDFLGAPDEDMTTKAKKAAPATKKKKKATPVRKKSAPAKKKKKKVESSESEDESEEDEASDDESDDDDTLLKKPKMPGEKALRKWVKAYVTCFNLEKATTKHAMETASDKFGIDLSEKKALIKQMLRDEM